jgi:type II secretory pathway pseudopilin PulG
MLTVMAVIAVLASLILSVNTFVQKKAATTRAEGEIAAISAACETYKADNGGYPRTLRTDELNPKTNGNPSQPIYREAALDLYVALSGDAVPGTSPANLDVEPKPDGRPEGKVYMEFKRETINFEKDTDGNIKVVRYIQDPFGNCYGYSTAGAKEEEAFQKEVRKNPNAAREGETKGYNPTFDLWSTAGSSGGTSEQAVKKWIKNW